MVVPRLARFKQQFMTITGTGAPRPFTRFIVLIISGGIGSRYRKTTRLTSMFIALGPTRSCVASPIRSLFTLMTLQAYKTIPNITTQVVLQKMFILFSKVRRSGSVTQLVPVNMAVNCSI